MSHPDQRMLDQTVVIIPARNEANVQSGDTVLDLGAGGGKLCYIAAQIVGPQGRVIGVDCLRR